MIELPKGITLIAAIGQSGQLGLRNQLPWPDDKEDMKWFQQVTRDCRWCIAGHNTFLSLPKSLFQDSSRTFIIDQSSKTPEQFLVYWWGDDQSKWPDKLAIIGGAKTYQRWMPFARTILLTKIQYDGIADTWMPPIWNEDEHLRAPLQ